MSILAIVAPFVLAFVIGFGFGSYVYFRYRAWRESRTPFRGDGE